MMKLGILTFATIFLTIGATAQQSEGTYQAKAPERIGNMTLSSFQEVNAKGTQMVNAITPTAERLSPTDQALFNQVAMGGMRQLAISQAVLNKLSSDKVRLLAQSEVDEQTNLSAKLKEVASAKGISLPAAIDPAVTAIVERINAASSAEVDALYLDEGGIKGHELLETTMKTVKKSASDATMKALATATLPVIKTQLKVSKKERKEM